MIFGVDDEWLSLMICSVFGLLLTTDDAVVGVIEDVLDVIPVRATGNDVVC